MIKKIMLSILFGLLAFGLSTNAFAEEYDFEINGNGLVLCSTLSGDTNCGHAHVILKFNQGAEGTGENTVSATITTRSGYSVNLHSIGEPLAFVTPDDNTFSDSVKIIATLVDGNKNIWSLKGDGIFQHYQNRPSDYNLDLVFTESLGDSFTTQIIGKSWEIIPENTLLPEIGDEVFVYAKGISKCDSDTGDFCNPVNTKIKFNLEINEINEKFSSGVAKGQIILDPVGDILELKSDLLTWTSKIDDCQVVLKGILHDQNNNKYKVTTSLFGSGGFGATVGACMLFDVTNHGVLPVYVENEIINSKGNVFSGQYTGIFKLLESVQDESK